MNRTGLGLAIGAGYLLGRTKKLKMAMAVGGLVAGKKLNLSPRMVADLVQQQLRNNPQFKEIGDQLRQDLRGVGKAASGAMVERQIDALADRLHGRTAKVRDQLTGVVPGQDDEAEDAEYEDAEEEEPEAEEEEEPEAEEEEEPEAEEEEEPEDSEAEEEEEEEPEDSEAEEEEEEEPAAKKAPAKKAPAKKAPAKKAAKKAPAKKAPAKKAPAKKAPAKKTAGRKAAGKKTTPAKKATSGRGGAARSRLQKGGGEE
ncbi:DNA primase [Streptomyces paradoxus]|uniref:Chemotaxis protein histidine kinase CheA n=1 Tax=Streptomyces paradoxus TaxID=66375 RepID=A0A7W9T646_9ACTN|nr:DNA primase [Streptomyces paradoxus]MBB6074723.1 chemotaxis protein histidine kinase CheA [Streptomyces paradoxus]